MSVILDTGALLALERGGSRVQHFIKAERLAGRAPRSHGGVIAQAWRGGARQALLARALAGIEVVPLDLELGRSAGQLLGQAGMDDVIDAALVLLARDEDRILTSDPDDIARLAEAAGVEVDVIRV